MQVGFYFDQTRCIGCYACIVACKDLHSAEEDRPAMCGITTIERGRYPRLFLAFLFSACYHCAEPACIGVCPAGAITKAKADGIVVVDEEKCLGKDVCGACKEACSYDAPVFSGEADGRMQKCDLCRDRVVAGLSPVCVGACRTRALDVGPIDLLRTRYGWSEEAAGFTSHAGTNPSILFRTK